MDNTPKQNSPHAFAPLDAEVERFKKRFIGLRSSSLRRLQDQIKPLLEAGWRLDGPLLSVTRYVTGSRSRGSWSQALCLPL